MCGKWVNRQGEEAHAIHALCSFCTAHGRVMGRFGTLKGDKELGLEATGIGTESSEVGFEYLRRVLKLCWGKRGKVRNDTK